MFNLKYTHVKNRITLLVLAIALIAVSCKNQQTKTQEAPSAIESVKKEVVQIMPNLRSSARLAEVMNQVDAKYYADIPNTTSNTESYANDVKKAAANLGVYMADFMYTISTTGYNESSASYDRVMNMAAQVGLADVFPGFLRERLRGGDLSADSVFTLLDKALNESEQDLSEGKKQEIFAAILLGNYVEKLHITSELILKPSQSDLPVEVSAELKRKLLLFMVQQRKPLEALLKLVSESTYNLASVLVVDDINELILRYKELEGSKGKLLKLDSAGMMNADEVIAIQKQIDKVRTRIIS